MDAWTTFSVWTDVMPVDKVYMSVGLLVREITAAYKCRRAAYAVLVELPDDVGLAFCVQMPPRVLQEEDLVLSWAPCRTAQRCTGTDTVCIAFGGPDVEGAPPRLCSRVDRHLHLEDG